MYKIKEKPIKVQCGLTQYWASIVGNMIFFFFFLVSEKSDQNASHTGGSPGPVVMGGGRDGMRTLKERGHEDPPFQTGRKATGPTEKAMIKH